MNQQPSEQRGFRLGSHTHRWSGDCRMVDEAIDEYTLGVLDPAHCVAIERHLDRCSHCAALVTDYRRTVAVLALAVPLVSPPASAKTALMARIAETPRASMPGTVYAGSLDAFRTPSLPASSTLVPPQATPAAHPAWWRAYAAPLATLPLLLALGLVAAWGFNNYSALHDSRNAVAQRDLQIARLSSQLSTENSQGVANLFVSPSAMRYTLAPEVNVEGDTAKGMLVADSASNQAAVQVSGLPAGSYTVVVQLQNGTLVPMTEFEVGAQGSATTLVDLGAQVTDVKSVRIRPTTVMTESDVAIDVRQDVLMTTIGPDISDDADTSVQKP